MGGVTVIFCGKSCDDGVVHFSAEDGAVGLDDDVVLGAEFDDWSLLAERVKLGVQKYMGCGYSDKCKKQEGCMTHLDLVHGGHLHTGVYYFL